VDSEEIVVKMTNIHKRFGKINALEGVDIEIRRGEILGLVGDNGAGKSTLIKILTGVYNQDEGEILYKGRNVRFISPKESRENGIETIYQEQALVDGLSIWRNIFLGKELVNVRGVGALNITAMKQGTRGILESLNLPIDVDRLAGACSGGQRQGIAIGRAMYFKADLVILDEPTRALGVNAIRRLQELILALKEKGIAIIYISHEFHHLLPVADRFVVLVQGKKIADIPKGETSVENLCDLISQR